MQCDVREDQDKLRRRLRGIRKNYRVHRAINITEYLAQMIDVLLSHGKLKRLSRYHQGLLDGVRTGFGEGGVDPVVSGKIDRPTVYRIQPAPGPPLGYYDVKPRRGIR